MAVSFPTSPSSGDTFNVGRVKYEWSGSAWKQVSSQPVSTGAEIPFTRSDGTTSDPVKLSSSVIGDALVNDTTPQLGGDLDISGNENISITPHGTGSVVISKADINGGAIDGTIIGATTTAAISGTTGTFSGVVTGATLAGTISTAAQNSITSASSLATVGTVTTGAWQGTDVAIAHGGTGASTASAARTNLGITTYAAPHDMSIAAPMKVTVASGVVWTLGWWQSSDGRWWLLGNTANVSSFARGDAEFYIPTGDMADVPSS